MDNELVKVFFIQLTNGTGLAIGDTVRNYITYDEYVTITKNDVPVIIINVNKLQNELERAPQGTRDYFPGLFSRLLV